MKMGSRIALIGAVVASGFLTAATAPLDKVSYSKDVQRIFDRRCVVCHTSGDHVGELVLDSGISYAQLVGSPSSESATMLRVKPGRPQESYLYRKVEGTHLQAGGQGWQMPPPSSTPVTMSVAEQRTIEAWIREGARNN